MSIWNVSQFSQFSHKKLLRSGNKKYKIVQVIQFTNQLSAQSLQINCPWSLQHALLQVEQAVETFLSLVVWYAHKIWVYFTNN